MQEKRQKTRKQRVLSPLYMLGEGVKEEMQTPKKEKGLDGSGNGSLVKTNIIFSINTELIGVQK